MAGGFKVLHLMRPFQGLVPEIETPLRKVSLSGLIYSRLEFKTRLFGLSLDCSFTWFVAKSPSMDSTLLMEQIRSTCSE
jgi:hypothetical protein